MSIPEWSFIIVGNKLFNDGNDKDKVNDDIENMYDNITIEDSLTIIKPDITLIVDPIKNDENVVQLDIKDGVIHEVKNDVIETFFYHMFHMISEFFTRYEYIYELFS